MYNAKYYPAYQTLRSELTRQPKKRTNIKFMFYSHEFGARPSLVNIENKGEMKFQTLFSFAFLPRLNTISIVIQAFTGMGDFLLAYTL